MLVKGVAKRFDTHKIETVQPRSRAIVRRSTERVQSRIQLATRRVRDASGARDKTDEYATTIVQGGATKLGAREPSSIERLTRVDMMEVGGGHVLLHDFAIHLYMIWVQTTRPLHTPSPAESQRPHRFPRHRPGFCSCLAREEGGRSSGWQRCSGARSETGGEAGVRPQRSLCVLYIAAVAPAPRATSTRRASRCFSVDS